LNIYSPETPIHSYTTSNLVLYSGGNNKTVFFKSDPLQSKCWVVIGVGLKESGDEYKNLDLNDWDNYLSSEKIDLRGVNGHFVVVKYANDELNFYTDELGLREIYLVKLPEGFGFTSRVDWLKYFIDPELDLQEFGSRWLLQNQISRSSIIKNVKRLVCANATIKNNNLRVEENPWQPDSQAIGGKEKFDNTLKKFLSINGKKISLSLSGGLDSRLLLSYLLNKNSELWETHTFGDPNHPDSKIASDLLKAVNLENEIINEALPSKGKIIDLLKTYAVHSVVTNPISSILNLRFYDRIGGGNKIVIDGGFGEIWRREFANRLLLLGKKAVLEKDSKRIYEFLSHTKTDIFSKDILDHMQKGAIEQIDTLLKELPDLRNISPARWVDLFSIRTRLPNYYAPEQVRVDQYVLSFMPLVQKDILKMLFGLKDADKINGKLFKELVEQNSAQLTKLPLVKGNIIHPFNFSSLSARLYSRVKYRIGLYYRSNQPVELFNSVKEFISDLLQSSEVRNCELYDRGKINKIAKDLSLNEGRLNSKVDWWLSFELFRQGISN
jgi:hypothetical protein